MKSKLSIALIANSSWYLYNFRLPLLLKIKSQGHTVFIIAPKDKYTKILTSHGFATYEWELNRKSVNIINETKSILNLLNILKSINPDLIHNFTIKPCIYGTLISKIIRIKFVINSITGLGHVFISKSIFKKFLKLFLIQIYKIILNSKKNIIIFQNENDQKIFKNLGITKNSKTYIIPGSGVDINYFSSSKEKKLFFQEPIKIFFPARIIKEKGIIELLIAFKSLVRDGFKVELIIAGNIDIGNSSSLKKKQIQEIKKIKRLKLLGHVKNMKELYEEVDIVVLPSWREGLSKTLIEAGAMSKPVITTNVPGCKDIIDHGINGILIPFKDPKSLELAIKLLIYNEKLALRLGRNLRKKVVKSFDQRTINNKTINIYYLCK